MICAIDHVQLAMPVGQEDLARRFYRDLLGLVEVPKPRPLAVRGGCWFRGGPAAIHLGEEAEFRPARKAHPALRATGFDALLDRLRAGGVAVCDNSELPGVRRVFVADPFGNRIELIEQHQEVA